MKITPWFSQAILERTIHVSLRSQLMTIFGVFDLSDPDAVAEIESKDEGNGHLRSQICPEEEEEEDDERVFEPLSTLIPHKTHQCHLTGK